MQYKLQTTMFDKNNKKFIKQEQQILRKFNKLKFF